MLTIVFFFILGIIERQSTTNSYGYMGGSNSFAFIMIAILSVTVIFDVVLLIRNQDCIIILMGYFTRLVLLFVDRFSFSLPFSGIDAENFHNFALRLTMGVSKRTLGGSYTQILAFIYKIYNGNRIVGQYVNVLCSVATIVIVYRTLRIINVSRNRRRLGIILLCFAPTYAISSSILLREAMISFLIACSLNCFVHYWYSKERLNHYFIFAIGFCLLAATLHTGAIAPAAGYIAIYMLYDKERNQYDFSPRIVSGIILSLFTVMVLYRNFGQVFFGRFMTVDIESAVLDSTIRGSGGSGYHIGISSGNFLVDMAVNTPIRLIYYYFAPMPWDWRGLRDVMAFILSSCFYLYGYLLAIKTLLSKRRNFNNRNLTIAVLIALLAGSFVFAWGVSNAGTAIRHRDKFIALYVLMIVLCQDYRFEVLQEKRNRAL